MNARILTGENITELVQKIRITPGRETDFEDALHHRDWSQAVGCCRQYRVEDVVDGIMGSADLPGGIGYIPRYELFAELTCFLSDDEYFTLLGTVWVEIEKRVEPVFAEVLFLPSNRETGKRKLVMLPEERNAFDQLPMSFPVYRGCTRDTSENCSWTRSYDIALYFAQKPAGIVDALNPDDQTPVVFRGLCSRTDVLAVFTRWGEEEIVVDPSRLSDNQEIWHG